MRTICEITLIKDGTEDNIEPTYERKEYYLLHFGLKYQVIDCGDGRLAVGSWTVAICQDQKTGQIKCFLPEQLIIKGTTK